MERIVGGNKKRARRNPSGSSLHAASPSGAERGLLSWEAGGLYQRPSSLLEPLLCERCRSPVCPPGKFTYIFSPFSFRYVWKWVGDQEKISNCIDMYPSSVPRCTLNERQWPKEHFPSPWWLAQLTLAQGTPHIAKKCPWSCPHQKAPHHLLSHWPLFSLLPNALS